MPIPPVGEGTTDWDPPRHLAIRMEQGEWFNALEYTIEGSGGSSTLRYVHNGIFVDDWDNQYDAVNQHTDFYLHTLGQYLEHFAGQTATFIGEVPGGIQGPPRSATPDGFERFKAALGLGSDTGVGDAVHLTPSGLTSIEGVVDYLSDNFVGIRTPSALLRLFGRNAFGQPVGLSIHDFAPVDDPEGNVSTWKMWLDTTLA
jgi:hypothetical protein